MKVLLIGGNGYIGSSFYHRSTHEIHSVDLCLFKNNLGYSTGNNFNTYDISESDVVVCLAGHSSVPMCEHSPSRSWTNNVDYFRNLCERLKPNQKLIYASSASVYGNSTGISYETSDINFNVLNHYDLQKITVDLIANKYIAEGKNIIGLRFGTVNGASPNTRNDLMINSMVNSALNTGLVNVKNTHIRRAILGINDVSNALNLLVDIDIKPGQYNLASFNSRVGYIADTVARITSTKVVEHPNDKLAYDFELSTEKFCSATGFEFKDTVESLIDGLIQNRHYMNFDVRDNDRNFQYYLSE
jgi:nucleoside-diphosphate-sugar epimerase